MPQIHTYDQTNETRRPIVGVTIGDPAGVGPEVVVKACAALADNGAIRIVVYGPGAILEETAKLAGARLELRRVDSPASARFAPGIVNYVDIPCEAKRIAAGEVSAEAGRVSLDSLRLAAEACTRGVIQGMATAPTNKTSMRAAGARIEGQTQFLGELWGSKRYGMLVIAGQLRVLLMTRHVPLRDALDSITTKTALDHLCLLADTLPQLGAAGARVALAGFNPHAGEGGMFGAEDSQILEPAVRAARNLGIQAEGPLPADSLFARAARGDFDGVVALYHDQGLIPAKTVAFDTAVTLIAGAPYVRVSVIHGAGFDRAGKNSANPKNMIAAVERAAEWCATWRIAR
jgi:4-hydroxythreonine-4-phosphate dehydrogenase